MDIQEKEAIEKQFERNLELLVRGNFPLTATAIVTAEQPMILLFKELIHRIEKREYELDKKEKIINEMAMKINEAYFDENDFWIWFEKGICKGDMVKADKSKQILDYFTKKAEGN